MSVYHSLLYVAFLISFAQCQITLTKAEISTLLQMIQNKPGTQTSPQANNVDTVQLVRKLMAMHPQQHLPMVPQQPTALPPQRRQNNGGIFGASPMNNYLTARAFDFPDMYTNMMLFNGAGGGQQQTNQQTQNQAFDPTLLYLTGF